MSLDEIYAQVAKELNLSKEVVSSVYKTYWLSIRSTIKDLPLKSASTIEEYSKLKTNFNIPSLGKLNCTFDRLQKVNKKFDLIKKVKHDKDKEC